MPELRSPLPCTDCSAPQAVDVRHALGQDAFRNGANLSPSGTPLQCCLVRIVVDVPSAPAAPSAGGMFSFGGRRSAGGWPFGKRPPLFRAPS
jgi:hypothetical protein